MMTTLLRYAVVLAIVLGSFVATFSCGVKVGVDRETAAQSRIDKATQDTREAALQGAAEAIAKIKVTNTTIKGEVQREVQTNTVYRDCRVPADGMRIINDAIRGNRSISPGSSELSRPGTAGG